MLSLNTIGSLKFLIAMIAAYFPTVTISGYFEALTARKMGDHSEYVAAFISWNPMMHANFLGLASIILAVFADLKFFIILGFGQTIPVNLQAIDGQHRWLKLCAVLFIRPVVNLLMLMLAVVILVFLGGNVLPGGAIFTSLSSLTVALQSICTAVIFLNMLAFILYTVYGLFKLVLVYAWPDGMVHSGFSIFMFYAIPVLMFLLLAPYLRNLLIFLIYGIEVSLRAL
ncbi:MAG TPA: hypothetical protein VJJ81_04415 [Candidatus Babeliales bacterium]|nr:hypothetical protein [Candidatus Babeliales bacterium]